MNNEADVLVIGGGIAGVSTLYHHTKMGWSNVMLTEKLDLTSGSGRADLRYFYLLIYCPNNN